MKVPVVQGVIDRRILLNYRVDPDALAAVLPPPFRPRLVSGRGVAGICLIRLRNLRPRGLPAWLGLRSENAAHRIAVEWDDAGGTRQGVYVPRRDTSSRLNLLLGGRVFPGVHHHARFRVREEGDGYRVRLDSDDGETRLLVEVQAATFLPRGSIFGTLDAASAFFEAGSLGYSATPREGEYEGLELRSLEWRVEPMAVTAVESSFFDDAARFPRGTAVFDCALLMRSIRHEWHAREPMCVPARRETAAAAAR